MQMLTFELETAIALNDHHPGNEKPALRFNLLN